MGLSFVIRWFDASHHSTDFMKFCLRLIMVNAALETIVNGVLFCH